ncbi:MAG: acyl-CoA dehydrogenase family protein [Thermoplasmata archaeon]
MPAPPEPSRFDRLLVREAARTRLARWAEEAERSDRLPSGAVPELAALGWTGIGIPAAYGGIGGGTQEMRTVLEEVSQVSATIATDLSVHLSVCAAPILRWGNEAQRSAWLPRLCRGEILGAFALTEPGVGSDASRLTTRYERTDHGFRLRGSKMFITNGGRAGIVLVFATRDPSLGARGISAFLLPGGTPGLSAGPPLAKLGLRGSETHELVLADVDLPPESLLGREGEGLSIAIGALMGGRIGIAACALGVAQAAYDLLLGEVARRPSEQGWAELARAFTRLEGARLLIDRAAREKDAEMPFERWASAAKLAASTAAMEIAQAALDASGPAGVRSGHPAGRLLRDARVFPIVEGSTEIQERILGRSLARDGADGSPPPP